MNLSIPRTAAALYSGWVAISAALHRPLRVPPGWSTLQLSGLQLVTPLKHVDPHGVCLAVLGVSKHSRCEHSGAERLTTGHNSRTRWSAWCCVGAVLVLVLSGLGIVHS